MVGESKEASVKLDRINRIIHRFILLLGLLILGLGSAGFVPSRVTIINGKSAEQRVWDYLRDNQQIQPSEKVVEIIAVGDLMLGRNGEKIQAPFTYVADIISAADLAIGNLEGIFSKQEPLQVLKEGTATKPIRLFANPAAALELKTAGFDLVSLANNHALDGGEDGLRDTISTLTITGIRVVGAGSPIDSVDECVQFELEDVKMCFLAVNAVNDAGNSKEIHSGNDWGIYPFDRDRICRKIHEAKQKFHIVILLIHWGNEFDANASVMQQKAAREFLDAGVDAVIGSHPHTVQEIQIDDGGSENTSKGLVAYSLGNFVSDQYDERSRNGLVLRLLFDQVGLRAAGFITVNSGLKPAWEKTTSFKEHSSVVKIIPKKLAFRCRIDRCQNADPPNYWQDGKFHAGTIDLTGDGIGERIQLVGKRALIFEEDDLVWESPPEWEIQDIALGDPNQDGRGEALLAVLKMDGKGKIRSHPFMVGYRKGSYRLIWGGSAVAYPIRELELADLDGDKIEELIVLEERNSNEQAITVWRWREWYFQNGWSSPLGQYSKLKATGLGNTPALILVENAW